METRIGRWRAPTLAGAEEARQRIAPWLHPTPLYRYPALDRIVGTTTWVKHENHLPVGAFKVRGGVNLVSQLPDDERGAGVVAASTGNHGQSVAYAARLFEVDATICVPEGTNPVKVEAMKDLGARIVVHGRDFDDAREHAQQLAGRDGLRYIHSGDEPLLIEGVGTYALEILDELPEAEVVFVPVGGGSGAAGVIVAGKGRNPALEVVGVQAAAAPAAYRSWKARALLEDVMETSAEGLATRTAFELPQRIMWEGLDDFVLIDENEIQRAVVSLISATRNLAEGAGAAALAGAVAQRDRLKGRRVVIVLSGGNITLAQLRAALDVEDAGLL